MDIRFSMMILPFTLFWLVPVLYVALSKSDNRLAWTFATMLTGPLGLLFFLAFGKKKNLPPPSTEA